MKRYLNDVTQFIRQFLCFHHERVLLDNDVEFEQKTMMNGKAYHRTRLHSEYQCPDCDLLWDHVTLWGPWRPGYPHIHIEMGDVDEE